MHLVKSGDKVNVLQDGKVVNGKLRAYSMTSIPHVEASIELDNGTILHNINHASHEPGNSWFLNDQNEKLTVDQKNKDGVEIA